MLGRGRAFPPNGTGRAPPRCDGGVPGICGHGRPDTYRVAKDNPWEVPKSVARSDVLVFDELSHCPSHAFGTTTNWLAVPPEQLPWMRDDADDPALSPQFSFPAEDTAEDTNENGDMNYYTKNQDNSMINALTMHNLNDNIEQSNIYEILFEKVENRFNDLRNIQSTSTFGEVIPNEHLFSTEFDDYSRTGWSSSCCGGYNYFYEEALKDDLMGEQSEISPSFDPWQISSSSSQFSGEDAESNSFTDSDDSSFVASQELYSTDEDSTDSDDSSSVASQELHSMDEDVIDDRSPLSCLDPVQATDSSCNDEEEVMIVQQLIDNMDDMVCGDHSASESNDDSASSSESEDVFHQTDQVQTIIIGRVKYISKNIANWVPPPFQKYFLVNDTNKIDDAECFYFDARGAFLCRAPFAVSNRPIRKKEVMSYQFKSPLGSKKFLSDFFTLPCVIPVIVTRMVIEGRIQCLILIPESSYLCRARLRKTKHPRPFFPELVVDHVRERILGYFSRCEYTFHPCCVLPYVVVRKEMSSEFMDRAIVFESSNNKRTTQNSNSPSCRGRSSSVEPSSSTRPPKSSCSSSPTGREKRSRKKKEQSARGRESVLAKKRGLLEDSDSEAD